MQKTEGYITVKKYKDGKSSRVFVIDEDMKYGAGGIHLAITKTPMLSLRF